jgi:hypothetical protein
LFDKLTAFRFVKREYYPAHCRYTRSPVIAGEHPGLARLYTALRIISTPYINIASRSEKHKMSKFVEILDEGDGACLAQRKMSESDVKLEDVLADHEATVNRSRSSTQSSSKSQHSPSPSWAESHTSSPSSPSSSSSSSPTSPQPKIKRLRKFTLTGGFSSR